MTRYLSQKDVSSCCPIALMNALRFQGQKIPYRRLPFFRRLMEWEPALKNISGGVWSTTAAKVYRKYGFKKLHYRNRKDKEIIQELNDWLIRGNACIMELAIPKGEDNGELFYSGHPVFVPGIYVYNGVIRYYCINIAANPPSHRWLTTEEISKIWPSRYKNNIIITSEIWKVPRT